MAWHRADARARNLPAAVCLMSAGPQQDGHCAAHAPALQLPARGLDEGAKCQEAQAELQVRARRLSLQVGTGHVLLRACCMLAQQAQQQRGSWGEGEGPVEGPAPQALRARSCMGRLRIKAALLLLAAGCVYSVGALVRADMHVQPPLAPAALLHKA